MQDKEICCILTMNKNYDVIVIGGGFYGSYLALSLSKKFSNVLLIEKESDLLKRASFVNQARIHNGYHYPRSILTASRSFLNFPFFVNEFKDSIDDSFQKIYAVATNQSKINSNQFYKFCKRIGAPIEAASKNVKSLFDRILVEEAFAVTEVAFNADHLRDHLKKDLKAAHVTVLTSQEVKKIIQLKSRKLAVELADKSTIESNLVFNTTYAQINSLLTASGLEPLPFKYEIAELALIEVPDELKNLGITLVDGPFFSTMPFPSRDLHSLSHVRYTPQKSWDWTQENKNDFNQTKLSSNFIYMLNDAQRYLPILRKSKYKQSLFDVKTILVQNEIDDGRPILFRKDHGLKNLFVVMGGKIDNIYDIAHAVNLSLTPQNA